MRTVDEISKAIAALPREEFWKLTDQLVEMRGDAWDRQMEEDAAAGRLDFLFEEADAEAAAGSLRAWPEPGGAV